MRFNSLGNALTGTSATTIAIDGVNVPCLVGHTAGIATGFGWITADTFAIQTDIFGGLKLTKVTVSTNTPTLIDAIGTTSLAAGNGVVAAYLSGSGMRWPLGGPASQPLAGAGDVSPEGLTAVIQNASAGTGVVTYAAIGTQLSAKSITLAGGSEIRAKSGIYAYRDSAGTHLRSLTTGDLQSYAPRTGDITFQCIPITVNGATWVVEAVGSGTSTLSIRPATSSNGFILATGDTFYVDAVVVGSEVWIGWGTAIGEANTQLRIAAITVSTGALRTGTTASGSLVFTTQPDLTQSTFAIGPVEGGDNTQNLKQPRHAIKDDAFVGGPDGKRVYQKYWDNSAALASGPIDASRIVPPIPDPEPSFGTVVVTGQSDVQAQVSGDAVQLIAGSNITITTDATAKSVTIAASGSGSTAPGFPGIDGDDGLQGPPGPAGATGATGATGPAGITTIIGFFGPDGDDGIGIPGPTGATGATGATGPPGVTTIIGFMGDDGDDGFMGPPGPTGATGPQGPAGASGSGGGFPGMPGDDGDDGALVFIQPPITAAAVSRVGYWSELTDGDSAQPELIFASGSTIDVFVVT